MLEEVVGQPFQLGAMLLGEEIVEDLEIFARKGPHLHVGLGSHGEAVSLFRKKFVVTEEIVPPKVSYVQINIAPLGGPSGRSFRSRELNAPNQLAFTSSD